MHLDKKADSSWLNSVYTLVLKGHITATLTGSVALQRTITVPVTVRVTKSNIMSELLRLVLLPATTEWEPGRLSMGGRVGWQITRCWSVFLGIWLLPPRYTFPFSFYKCIISVKIIISNLFLQPAYTIKKRFGFLLNRFIRPSVPHWLRYVVETCWHTCPGAVVTWGAQMHSGNPGRPCPVVPLPALEQRFVQDSRRRCEM